jgi:hypothetical protein
MTGRAALFSQLFPIAIAVIMIGSGIAQWRHPKPRRQFAVFPILIGSVVLLLFGSGSIHSFANRQRLQHLTAEEIVSITINGVTFRTSEALVPLTAALTHLEAYVPNHDREPDLPLVITLRSGQIYQYRVRYRADFGQSGAVIQFVPAGAAAYSNEGYAFSADLPTTLQALGQPLPTMPRQP